LQQLRDLPPEAKADDVEQELATSRCMLGTLETNGQQTYGMIRLPDTQVESVSQSSGTSPHSTAKASVIGFGEFVPGLKIQRFLPDALCLLSIASLFSIILAYWCVLSGPFNNWMNGRRFGTSMVLSVHGLVVTY
jgi:hypothetical protein